MATSGDDSAGSDGQVWDGYSDYRTVSSRIGSNIFDAIDAYARVHSCHVEGARVRPTDAAEARSRILAASMSLMVELEDQRDTNEDIDDILLRWQKGRGGASLDVDIPDNGFLRAFDAVTLTDQDPRWLYQFVVDIRRAGWELGYLKAGRHEETGPRELEPRDVNELLEPSG